MWFTFVMARLFSTRSFQPRLTATLLRACSVVNSPTRRTGLSPVFQPASLAQRTIRHDSPRFLGGYWTLLVIKTA